MGIAKRICSHKVSANLTCPFACLEYADGKLIIVNRHAGAKHVNFVPVRWVIEQAVLDGKAEILVSVMVELIGAERLTKLAAIL